MAYLIGIDVGGTNTNGVLLKDNQVLMTVKAPTDHHNLHRGTKEAITELLTALPRIGAGEVDLHLSTTLATNAVVEGKGAPTAVLIIPGPGLRWEELRVPFKLYPISGYIDHRGREVWPLERTEIHRRLMEIKAAGYQALAVVGKFSPRNFRHELEIESIIAKDYPELLPVTLGHRLSGKLNFPRRIVTAALNASIARIQADFVRMVQELKDQYKQLGNIYLLKADGGTLALQESLNRSIETILSGPAASLMGTMALTDQLQNAVALDIGGTTTEISIFSGGEPLAEREGAVIAGFPTLVPAFFSRSIGLGGDSVVTFDGEQVTIGPQREGPPVALGGPRVTPTDAVIVLGGAFLGNPDRSFQALQAMGAPVGCTPLALAEKIVHAFAGKAARVIKEIYTDLNNRPVYTVSQVLAGVSLKPERLIGMGGPAAYFIPKIGQRLGLPVQVLPYHEAANAIGAAASRPTFALTLRADTALAQMVVPELDHAVTIERPFSFNLERAREEAINQVIHYSTQMGACYGPAEIEITEEEVFNMVRGFRTIGKNYALRAQVKPKTRRIYPEERVKTNHPVAD
ncbi:MAG: hydantoinase/oxoprolinase family protein [Firmicutes bacterium]|nr:hydantoinase/oxoprolinase family protein [Bacillota bacterium]